VQFRVAPPGLPESTVIVSLHVVESPLVTVWDAGVTPTVRPASQLIEWLTVTGRFDRPARIVLEIWPTVGALRKTPPVAVAIAVAWPAPSRPSKRKPEVPGTLTAMTRIDAAFRAAMAWASVIPSLGLCEDESPKRTTIRVEPVRQPTAGSVASWKSALM
jgi:hypothetical protein